MGERTFFLNITRKRAELSPAPALCGTYLPVRSKERFGSRRTPCSRTFRKKKTNARHCRRNRYYIGFLPRRIPEHIIASPIDALWNYNRANKSRGGGC